MKTIEGNLMMKKEMIFDEDLKVVGSIFGKNGMRYNLIVYGNIYAQDIQAGHINALNINARDIDAWNINAWDINAEDIYAQDVICEKRIKKNRENKTVCRVFIQDKSSINEKDHRC